VSSRIRLVALDLDGTLLGADGRVTDRDLAAVRAAADRGVAVVLATSRWPVLSQQTAALLGLRAPQICHNGAEVLDEALAELDREGRGVALDTPVNLVTPDERLRRAARLDPGAWWTELGNPQA
jgi:hydroxymethylpyrimidine pyrophosphatase-like HAD family hydrolase